ncbi:MAG TPA: bifunctional riboflavin kinase/FAD synthetase [Methylophilaceae bacterium]|nr:bifunctional riboflavin kinase/FAD synthetase [Methylophilaceae bacterium]HQR60373.1 bifunctional riboflavin kinase/FAD synthetase [Methylophilaceae bacterium]
MQIFRHIPATASGPVALTIGNFDGIHCGHRAILDALRQKAQVRGLTPSVMTFEPHPREFFSPATAPSRLTSLREKLELFEELGMERVYLLRFNHRFAAISAQDFMQHILRTLDTRLILVGEDFRFGAARAGDVAGLRAAGFGVESVSTVELDGQRISSTAVREALAAGELAQAAALLGRAYSISGHVAHGDKLGRLLGYPTANIHMLHERPPLYGIYAVKLRGIDDEDLPGVASLGVRPTMKHNGRPTLEVHLFDFNRDIYGRHVRVQFLKKLRDEQKFPDLETLKRQIEADERAARDYFKNEK